MPTKIKCKNANQTHWHSEDQNAQNTRAKTQIFIIDTVISAPNQVVYVNPIVKT